MQAAVRRSQRRKHFGKSEGAARGDVAVVMGPQGLVKVRLVALACVHRLIQHFDSSAHGLVRRWR